MALNPTLSMVKPKLIDNHEWLGMPTMSTCLAAATDDPWSPSCFPFCSNFQVVEMSVYCSLNHLEAHFLLFKSLVLPKKTPIFSAIPSRSQRQQFRRLPSCRISRCAAAFDGFHAASHRCTYLILSHDGEGVKAGGKLLEILWFFIDK